MTIYFSRERTVLMCQMPNVSNICLRRLPCNTARFDSLHIAACDAWKMITRTYLEALIVLH